MNKKLLFSIAAVAAVFQILSAQSVLGYSVLDINQAHAGVNSNGALFTNYTTYNSQFEVPAGSGKGTIYADALWIGGYDSSGVLHMGAQTYSQIGNDFFGGPVSNASAYNTTFDNTWAQVWKINKSQIDSFVNWYANPSLYPNYSVPAVITTWPGNGDSNQGQAAVLAPYIDLNANGLYEPLLGEYPCIKGDQMIFAIYNDDRDVHTESGGQKMKAEIHMTVYGFSRPGNWLDSTVFVNYRVYNRSQEDYSDVFVAKWADLDIGSFSDDYVGSDVTSGLFYGYNGTANDGGNPSPGQGTYGANPPAQAIMFLRGPLADNGDGIDNDYDGSTDEPAEYCRVNRFMYYGNNPSPTGNPTNVLEFYNYMNSIWRDGSPLTYGGNGYGGVTPAHFMFPSNSDPLGFGTNMQPQSPWSEVTNNNVASDRRGLGASGPFTFEAGEMLCLDYAYLYARGSNGPISSVTRLQSLADSARNWYDPIPPCACNAVNPNSVSEVVNPARSISLYPNPATAVMFVNYEVKAANASWTITDITGRTVDTGLMAAGNSSAIDISTLPAGIYTLRIVESGQVSSARFTKQ
ncbi:MAG: T9SS type A sorting domain-containing protein [Bacteroidia bacterium]|jgi:hypothetical protein|nr:T9SS type A sorting domain-containing protein [Bacteroidia bacterium]